MKLTTQEAVELLTEAGVPLVEIVEKDSDFNKEEALTAIDTARQTIFRPHLESEIEKTVQKKFDGKVGGALSSLLARTFGMTVSEFDGLKDDEKIKKALDKHNEKFGKDAEGLRQEMETLMEGFKTEKETLIKEKDGQIAIEKEKYVSREIIENLAAGLKDMPLPKTSDRTAAARLYLDHLKSKYAINYNEAEKKLTLAAKDNPAMPVYINDAKTAFKKPTDDAKDFFEPLGLWVKDMRNEIPDGGNGQPNTGFQPNNGGQPNMSKSPLEKINEQVNGYVKQNEAAA